LIDASARLLADALDIHRKLAHEQLLRGRRGWVGTGS
jgi:hypothetical protein